MQKQQLLQKINIIALIENFHFMITSPFHVNFKTRN
jgi:hypothetical protein